LIVFGDHVDATSDSSDYTLS